MALRSRIVLAAATGHSNQQIALDLKIPTARGENLKFSKDPQVVEKVRDIVGLYLNPPDRATEPSSRARRAHCHGQLRHSQGSKVRNWFARHPRYHVHFTPTGGSWFNLVGRLFAELTERCVRRGMSHHGEVARRKPCSPTWCVFRTKVNARSLRSYRPASGH